MKAETARIMQEMIDHANNGGEVIPMFWQRGFGINASVSAAVRAAKKAGKLMQSGLDGCGKPKYSAPAKPLPLATHGAQIGARMN